jgi:hypothetical protein
MFDIIIERVYWPKLKTYVQYVTFITNDAVKQINFRNRFKITIPKNDTSILGTTGKTIFRFMNGKYSSLKKNVG